MSLFFTAEGIIERHKGLTFDDVLLVPCHSSIQSRTLPDLSTRVTRRFKITTPIVSANMDTVTEIEMAKAMTRLGGLGIIHRFMPTELQVSQVKELRKFLDENQLSSPISASVGVKSDGMTRADILIDAGAQIITVDIAHGDSIMMFETLEYIKKKYSHVDVIAGNTATPEGTRGLINAGADAIKVGIGPGSMCTTRLITGCGIPQLTAIGLCAHEAKKHNIPVIADGGIKTSGDIVKAFAAGAESVMLGSMLAGCLETPGEVKGGMKKYRGMASKDAQVSWRGELPKGMAAEGESRMIPCKGSVTDVLSELTGGIRSGMSYLNAQTLSDIHKNARFIEMSHSGMSESRPHGLF
jgi:IMP dehydrogenase